MRHGPWRVEERIGGGGMGVVHRAVHEVDGRIAALKTLTSDDHRLIAAFRREVRALARLRHPGLVRILEHGLGDDGHPWVAMELVEGVPMRAHAILTTGSSTADPTWHTTFDVDADADAQQSTPATVVPIDRRHGLTLFRRICEPLGWLHGEGLVHADLKPDNVVVRPDGSVVIVDFGLAVGRQGTREHVDAGRLVAGTVAYMSPEQVRGELPDPRSDLYALGCMLYEWLTGRTPFMGEPRAVAYAQLFHEPTPPAGIDEPMAELLAALLAKDPSARPRSAEAVAERLVACGATEEPRVGPPPRPTLFRPGLVGRERILEDVDRALDEREALLLVGASGAGKTRLLLEVGRRARGRGMAVHLGECPPPDDRGSRAPLGPLLPLIDAALGRCRDDEEVRALFGDGLGALARVVPRLGRHAVAGDAVGRALLLEAVDRAVVSLGDRVLILIDDIQWADDLTLGWLQTAAANRIRVICASRRDEIPTDVRLRRVELSELAPTDTTKLGSEILGAALPEPVARALREAGPVRPFHVAEYLELLAEEGALQLHGTRWEAPGDIPPLAGVQHLVRRRLAQLAPAESEVLGAAAVVGRRVDLATLAAVTGRDEDDTGEIVANLLRRRLLALDPDGGWSFAHDQVREAVLATLPEDLARGLHARAAARLAESDAEPAVLARHLLAAGAEEPAREAFVAAAHRAAAGWAYDTAEALARQAVALSTPAEQIDLRQWIISRVLSLRYLDRAEQEAVEIVQQARELGDEARLVAALDTVVNSAVSPERLTVVEAWTDEGLTLARRRGDRRAEASLLGSAATVRYRAGDVQGAVTRAEEAIAILEALGERPPFGLQHVLAVGLRELGQLDRARALLEDLIARGRDGSDPGATSGLAHALNSLAGLLIYQGEAREAEPLFAEALRSHRLRRDRVSEAYTLHDLAECSRRLGRTADARAHALGARAAFIATGHDPLAAFADLQLAELDIEDGRPERALATIDGLWEMLEANQLNLAIVEGHVLSARAWLALGDVGRADAAVAEAERIPSTAQVEAAILQLKAELAVRDGRADDGIALLQAARIRAAPWMHDDLQQALDRLSVTVTSAGHAQETDP